MLIPLPFKCQNQDCGAPCTIRIHLDDTSLIWKCQICGNQHHYIFPLDFTVGLQLLARSYYELEVEKDYSMVIILSAAALEGELSFLFSKWNRIDKGLENQYLRDEEIEKMLQLQWYRRKN